MVDTIRRLCKEKGTSIAQLEKQLKFGNGVIGRWGKSSPSFERLSAVADALGVPVSELTGENEKKPAPTDGDGLSADELELLAAFRGLSPKMRKSIIRTVQDFSDES